MTETVRPLELLHRTAEFLGATVCLTTTADARHAGRRVFTARTGAQLRYLVVVVPKRVGDLSRWERLARGTTLAQAEIVDAVPLDDVAQALCEELGQRIDQLRRRV